MSMPVPSAIASPGRERPRLLDQLRAAGLSRFRRAEPGERYADWARRYIVFHGKRHPRDLGAGDVGLFLEHVAQSEKEPLRCLEHVHEALISLAKAIENIHFQAQRQQRVNRGLDRRGVA